jgi:hypothetical protein
MTARGESDSVSEFSVLLLVFLGLTESEEFFGISIASTAMLRDTSHSPRHSPSSSDREMSKNAFYELGIRFCGSLERNQLSLPVCAVMIVDFCAPPG